VPGRVLQILWGVDLLDRALEHRGMHVAQPLDLLRQDALLHQGVFGHADLLRAHLPERRGELLLDLPGRLPFVQFSDDVLEFLFPKLPVVDIRAHAALLSRDRPPSSLRAGSDDA